MALMDEFRKERDAVKNQPLPQKLSYFWHYYKWVVALVLFVIVFFLTYIYPLLTRPETLISGVMLNTYNDSLENPAEDLASDFLKQHDIIDSEYAIDLNTSFIYTPTEEPDVATSNYEIMQVLLTKSSIGDLNFLTGDLESLTDLASKEFFTDLSEVLTEDQLTLYEPYLIYIEGKPLFIDMSQCKQLTDIYKVSHDTLCFGVVYPANKETLLQFIDYLMQ